ncbi:Gag-Pro-Pol polyprotein [Turdus rufiventris]|nr:Gag-Pro-Pol polyprotein [Turdus rufiventris]
MPQPRRVQPQWLRKKPGACLGAKASRFRNENFLRSFRQSRSAGEGSTEWKIISMDLPNNLLDVTIYHMNLDSEYFVIGDMAHTPLETEMAPMTMKGDITHLILLANCPQPPFYLVKGKILTQAIPIPAKVPVDGKSPEVYLAEVVGEITEGNRQVDSLVAPAEKARLPDIFQKAKLSHQQYHQNVSGLIRQFQLIRSQDWVIVATCPSCQLQAMPSLGERAVHAKQHLVQAFSVLGISREIKTDNGPVYVSKEFLEFVQQCGVEHKTGIPHSPTGQAVIERAHQTLKQVLARQSSSTVWLSPQQKLCKAMFTINFLNCSFENMSPPVVRHFNSGNQFKLSQRPPVLIRDPETWETKGPYELVTWGCGYAYVSTPSGPQWISQKWVKPFVPKHPAPAQGDEKQVAVVSTRRCRRKEETKSS